jgi:ornithine carbamoyltransferase
VPAGYEPDAAIFERAVSSGAGVTLIRDPAAAAVGADVVTTDVWASMGQEEEAEARARDFAGYRVDEPLMCAASDRAIFLHCLPVHRGEEVTEDVFEGTKSRVFDQAENRLHVQKALMYRLMGGGNPA